MPVKRRSNKRREGLSESAQKWLRGEPSMFQFKADIDFAAVWAEYGDTTVAYWDEAAGRPRALHQETI